MTAPLAVYGAALRQAAAGFAPSLEILDPAGATLTRVDAAAWVGDLIPGDSSLLARCSGPTLDVGCGSGRLVGALHAAGGEALGVDISAEAVRQARRRGAWAVRASVFEALPHEGKWRTILLADGNIGIGGDPTRLLHRCAGLASGDGVVMVELLPPGGPTWAGDVVLRGASRLSAPFPWATVAVDRIGRLCDEIGVRVADEWKEAGRWFVEICR